MPNLCDYSMRVKEEPEKVDEFVSLMQAAYDEKPRHFWRIFDAVVCDSEEKDGIKTVEIRGDCAWSVCSCMCEGALTYYSDHPDESTSLREQSGELGLEIEVYSEEPGMGFQEHYYYDHGEERISECVEYAELFFDKEEDFLAWQEETRDETFSWDDNREGWFSFGGFGDWVFQF